MRSLSAVLAAALVSGCASTGSDNPNASRDRTLAADRRAAAAATNVQLAGGYLEQGRVELALEKIERALELDPDSPEAHSVSGIIHERIGELDAARRHYRQAVRLEPASGQLLNNYGQFLCKTGSVNEGVEHLRKAVQDPFYGTPAVALTNAGACYEQAGDLAAAEVVYRQALSLDERYPDALYRMARVRMRQDDAFRARAFLQRFEQVSAPSEEALELGSRIEQALGNPDGARQYEERRRRLFGEPRGARATTVTDQSKP